MDLLEIQRAIAKRLSASSDSFYLSANRREAETLGCQRSEYYAAVWAMIAQGHLYVDAAQPDAGNWCVRLTSIGRAVAKNEHYDPRDPDAYLKRLDKEVPSMGPVVRIYIGEALHAYNAQLYLSSTMMLGVASEAAFLEMAQMFALTLSEKSHAKYAPLLDGFANFSAKVDGFRSRVEPIMHTLPQEVQDGMGLLVSSVLEAFRINRNEAGHATGRSFDRDDCFIALQMAARYMKRLYVLRDHFAAAVAAAAASNA